MTKIAAMIEETAEWVASHRANRRRPEAWIAATRLHALLDCYAALGGNVRKWRNEAGVLEKEL